MIDLSCGPPGRRNLRANVRADIRYWHRHLRDWNGRARWRADSSTPFVFGSDASTSGFAYTLESAPPEKRAILPPGFGVGDARVDTWSMATGDATRQATYASSHRTLNFLTFVRFLIWILGKSLRKICVWPQFTSVRGTQCSQCARIFRWSKVCGPRMV